MTDVDQENRQVTHTPEQAGQDDEATCLSQQRRHCGAALPFNAHPTFALPVKLSIRMRSSVAMRSAIGEQHRRAGHHLPQIGDRASWMDRTQI